MVQTPCAHCGAINRIGDGRDRRAAKCGRCHEALFAGKPVAVDGRRLDLFQRQTKGVALLLDVWAPWCGPCRQMAPHFDAAAAALSPDVILLKLDSDQHPETAARLKVQGIPALLLFRDGAVVSRRAGAMTQSQLVDWVHKALADAQAA